MLNKSPDIIYMYIYIGVYKFIIPYGTYTYTFRTIKVGARQSGNIV